MNVINSVFFSTMPVNLIFAIANNRNENRFFYLNDKKYEWNRKKCAFIVGGEIKKPYEVFSEITCNNYTNFTFKEILK